MHCYEDYGKFKLTCHKNGVNYKQSYLAISRQV